MIPIAIITADDRGSFVTRRSVKAQIRAAARGVGVALGQFTVEDGKLFKASARTDEGVLFSAVREVGADIVTNFAAKAPEPDVEPSDVYDSIADLEALGLDALGEYLAMRPADGGLSTGKMRAMLTAADITPPAGRVKRAAMVEAVTAAVLGTEPIREVIAEIVAINDDGLDF
jgi:hypothetical protein